MTRRLLFVVVLLAAALTSAETSFNAVSATDVSAYVYFSPARNSVLICNTSTTDAAYFRLFNTNDTPAVATTGSSVAPIAAGSVLNCVGFSKPPTSPSYYSAMSIIMASGKTATVNVYSE